ncbi:MAG TPA: DUF92 domain-containing protein, partial [Halococcus sp.]|nr:DUF92 domain-containing protein [Halococcus sp.]
ITAAGVSGMVIDSLLGATVENRSVAGLFSGGTNGERTTASLGGRRFDNKTVNFLATLAAAVVCAALAAGVGLAPL